MICACGAKGGARRPAAVRRHATGLDHLPLTHTDGAIDEREGRDGTQTTTTTTTINDGILCACAGDKKIQHMGGERGGGAGKYNPVTESNEYMSK